MTSQGTRGKEGSDARRKAWQAGSNGPCVKGDQETNSLEGEDACFYLVRRKVRRLSYDRIKKGYAQPA